MFLIKCRFCRTELFNTHAFVFFQLLIFILLPVNLFVLNVSCSNFHIKCDHVDASSSSSSPIFSGTVLIEEIIEQFVSFFCLLLANDGGELTAVVYST